MEKRENYITSQILKGKFSRNFYKISKEISLQKTAKKHFQIVGLLQVR